MSEVFRTVPRPEGDPNFKPVVIVLDRKIDATIWWLLHHEAPVTITRTSLRDRAERLGLDRDTIARAENALFEMFEQVYNPVRERQEEQQNEPDLPDLPF